MAKADVIILANTASQRIKDMTDNALLSLYNSEEDGTFNPIIVETNSLLYEKPDIYNDTYLVPVDNIIYPHEMFNYNRFLNIALKRCRNEYVVNSNNDVIFGKGFFSECVNAMNEYNLDSCSCYAPDWPPHKGLIGKITIGCDIGREYCGWNLIYRQSSINKMLPLDEQFTFFCQDNNMAIESHKLGMRHALVGTADVTHLVSRSHFLIHDRDYFEGNVDRFHNKYGH